MLLGTFLMQLFKADTHILAQKPRAPTLSCKSTEVTTFYIMKHQFVSSLGGVKKPKFGNHLLDKAKISLQKANVCGTVDVHASRKNSACPIEQAPVLENCTF